jgi:hypothetical protein
MVLTATEMAAAEQLRTALAQQRSGLDSIMASVSRVAAVEEARRRAIDGALAPSATMTLAEALSKAYGDRQRFAESLGLATSAATQIVAQSDVLARLTGPASTMAQVAEWQAEQDRKMRLVASGVGTTMATFARIEAERTAAYKELVHAASGGLSASVQLARIEADHRASLARLVGPLYEMSRFQSAIVEAARLSTKGMFATANRSAANSAIASVIEHHDVLQRAIGISFPREPWAAQVEAVPSAVVSIADFDPLLAGEATTPEVELEVRQIADKALTDPRIRTLFPSLNDGQFIVLLSAILLIPGALLTTVVPAASAPVNLVMQTVFTVLALTSQGNKPGDG